MTKLYKPLAASALLLATACGGGGGGSSSSSSSSSNPVTPTNAPTWTPGEFTPSEQFKGRCDTLRQNFWLRSWSDETYLWYDEITDRNPANFSNPITYFGLLKTAATTASGRAKDQFHFSVPTDVYEQQSQSGAGVGYGLQWAFLETFPPRDIRVAFVEDGSPADLAGFKRGMKVLSVDGINFITGSNTTALDNGIYPRTSGETHRFVVQEDGSNISQTLTVSSGVITSDPVLRTDTIEVGDTKVGYVILNTFGTATAEEAVYDAMTALDNDNVDELILDLRYNGGGFLAIASQLGYMIAGPTATEGKDFERLRFNDKHPVTDPVTNQTLVPTPFYKTGLDFTVDEDIDLPSLDLSRVFILSTDLTCSASESLINGLRGIDIDVVLIGESTCGKPYGFYPTGNCGETYFTIQFEGVNDKGFGDYADGFTPNDAAFAAGASIEGCTVSDDFSKELGDQSENLLETAISYIQNDSCPGTSAPVLAKVKWGAEPDQKTGDLMNDPRFRQRRMLETARILRRP